MINRAAALDAVFSALGDPTRRQIIERLAKGRLTISEVSIDIPISQPAISKHVRILERSGLVRREVAGRIHYLQLSPGAMKAASSWIDRQRAYWDAALERLDAYLNANTEKEKKKQ